MICVIYKGVKKPDSYLYIEEEDNFSRVPEDLLMMLGKLEYVMSLELHANLRLARVTAHEVMQHLEKQGFYLQLPPGDTLSTAYESGKSE